MCIIDRIRLLANQKGHSLTTLERELGFGNGTIGKWKKQSPSCEKVRLVADYLQTSIDFLYTGSEINKKLNDDEINLLKFYNKTSERNKCKIYDRAELLAELAIDEQQPEPVKRAPTPIKLKPNPAMHIEPTPSEPLSDEYTDTADWVTLTYYDAPASAGHGQSVDTPYDDLVMVPPSDASKDADYIICVSGDSMEPKYSNGDYVYVKKCDKIEESKIGIFILNGDSLIKQMGNKKLIPLNRNYRDIRLTPEDKCFCQGEVLGKVKDPKTMVWL